ncbi:TPA: hypothetical protein ACK3JR_001886 [Mannheimia haemolytica]
MEILVDGETDFGGKEFRHKLIIVDIAILIEATRWDLIFLTFL